MQHTEKYKLNLIETSDTFSPDALNENAQKVEGALAAAETALDQRVTALEVKKIVFGSYTPTKSGESMTIDLGFTPIAVLAMPTNIHQSCTAFCQGERYAYESSGSNRQMWIVENGFCVTSFMTNTYYTYNYVAFA